MNRPHIIHILSDEHYGGATSHAGDPNVRTPNMDRLAAEGASLSRAYANCPICTPSRGTIFSGRHAHAGPVAYFFDVYKPAAPSSATILQDAGYHTAYFGKWHCGIVRDQRPPAADDIGAWSPNRTPEHHRAGFQDWNGFEVMNQPFNSYFYRDSETEPRKLDGYQTDVLTDLAIEYLEAHGNDRPLYLVLSVEPPHFPLEAPEEYERFHPEALQVRDNFEDTPELRKQLATYYAMVENLDWNIGRLLDAIERLDTFKDRTLTIYTSDHGDFMGSHGLINRKEHPQEESVRIPAIFHWPGVVPAETRSDELFGLVDLLPTILGLVDVPIPTHIQGNDCSSLLRGEPFTGPEAQLIEMSGNPRWNLDFLDWRGLVTKEWKYAFYDTGHELLFNLADDPCELNNLATTDVDTRNRMKAALLDLLRETREPYFDVLIEHGVDYRRPIIDAGKGMGAGRIAPIWPDITRPDGK